LPRDQPADIVIIDMSSNDAMALDLSRVPGFHEGKHNQKQLCSFAL
jgi:hypothetical protein